MALQSFLSLYPFLVLLSHYTLELVYSYIFYFISLEVPYVRP